VTTGLAYVNPALGRLTQLHHLRAALAAGEPTRVARALCLEVPHTAQPGTRGAAEVAAATARAEALIDRLDRPDLRGLFDMCSAVAAGIGGRWRDASRHSRAAERRLRDFASAARWTLDL